MSGRGGLVAVLCTVACSFASEGSGLGGSHGVGDSADDAPAESGGVDDGDADDGDGTGGNGDGDGSDNGGDVPPPNDDGPGTPARLEVNGGAGFDFDMMAPNATQSIIVEVENVGGETATAITPMSLDPVFAYVGGFPGEGGTCGSSLDPATSCLIGLAYSPKTWGFHGTTLAVTYEGGDWNQAEAEISGICGGTSENLLINPSFEDGLASWVQAPMSWTTASMQAPSGNNVAYTGDTSNSVSLRQVVVVSQWANVIDDGDLQVILRGNNRSVDLTQDPNFFRVTFTDGVGGVLGTHETTKNYATSWAAFDDHPTAPPGTRAIEFAAICYKPFGSCEAYFDATNVAGRFPPQ